MKISYVIPWLNLKIFIGVIVDEKMDDPPVFGVDLALMNCNLLFNKFAALCDIAVEFRGELENKASGYRCFGVRRYSNLFA